MGNRIRSRSNKVCVQETRPNSAINYAVIFESVCVCVFECLCRGVGLEWVCIGVCACVFMCVHICFCLNITLTKTLATT